MSEPDREAIYLQLRSLMEEMPALHMAPTPDMYRWLGRVAPLIELTCGQVLAIQFRAAMQDLGKFRSQSPETLLAIVYEALGRAEFLAPAAYRGSFIAAGHTLNALAAVANALSTAERDVLIVDPYADMKLLTDYAPTAPEKISMRILTSDKYIQSLKPAAERWAQQHGMDRPLEVRLAPAERLHDRLIIIDGKDVWELHQSFKDLAARSHTSLSKMMFPEISKEKIAAYEDLWAAATSLA
jgi:hypothetical protein